MPLILIWEVKMNYEKGKLLRRERRVIDEKIAGHDVLRTEKEFQAICKTCNHLDPNTKITKVSYKFV